MIPGGDHRRRPPETDETSTEILLQGAHQEFRLAVPGGTLTAAARGTGPVVLCVHGLSGNRSSWRLLVRRLRRRFTFLLPDLPGRGTSPAESASRHGAEDEVHRLQLLVDAAGVEGWIGMGHSHGATLVLGLARRRADCRGLVLVNPVTPWMHRPPVLAPLRLEGLRGALASLLATFREPLARYILERRVFADPRRVTPELVRRYAAPYADPAQARALLRAVADWRPGAVGELLPAEPPPVRVLSGGGDRRSTPEEARRLATLLGAEARIVQGVGHALPEEDPEAVASALLELAPQSSAEDGDTNEHQE